MDLFLLFVTVIPMIATKTTIVTAALPLKLLLLRLLPQLQVLQLDYNVNNVIGMMENVIVHKTMDNL